MSERSSLSAGMFLQETLEIPARQDTGQLALIVYHRIKLLALPVVAAEGVGQVFHGDTLRKSGNAGPHDIADEKNLQWVNCVFPAQMVSPPGYLLGKDGPAEAEHCEPMGDDTGDQQRQEHVNIVGEFQSEDNASEGASASCRPGSRPC